MGRKNMSSETNMGRNEYVICFRSFRRRGFSNLVLTGCAPPHPPPPGEGTDLEYEDVRPWRCIFMPSRKGPISSKEVSSQDLLMRKFGNCSLHSLNFCPNFSSQAPNFQLTSPKFGIFNSQAPSFRSKYQFASPHTSEIRAAYIPLPEKTHTHKKLSAPGGGG